MLELYLGECAPHAAFVDVTSLNTPLPPSSDATGLHLEIIDTVPCPLPNPEQELEHHDLTTKVRDFVETLPAPLRIVIEMHFWRDCTQSEIAAELKISQSAVSQRIAKAIGLARKHFRITSH